MRQTIPFEIKNLNKFRTNLMEWAKEFDHFIVLDSNHDRVAEPKSQEYSSYSLLIAAGSFSHISPESDCFSKLEQYINSRNDWFFGHFNYDLKSETEGIPSHNPDSIEFPIMHFFQPRFVITLIGNNADIHYMPDDEKEAKKTILQLLENEGIIKYIQNEIKLESRISRDEYISAVSKLKNHIARGDIYEINYCIDFLAENATIDPYSVWWLLNEYSPAPFAAFYKNDSKFLLCSSPERFLKKDGKKLISQPIKGTSARNINSELDKQSKVSLQSNEKERAENIMIADLVRNDLSKVAVEGTVKVEQLCDVYSFKHVHQMISTISAELDAGKSSVDAIKHTFPMGSMTGAPKHSAVLLAEKYESFKRGLYSGSIGYFDPDGNFDFNVVIRSIQYNAENKTISIAAGSAITAQSEAEKEYEECLLKAEALKKILTTTSSS